MIVDDLALLRAYARDSSEEAFTTLVSRYVNLVHSVALRQVRDVQLAEEVTQAVFVILARKAGSLGANTILSGWLCRTARYASANALKIQRRRERHEQEAAMESVWYDSPSESEAWLQIAPLLDTALARLGKKDHDAVVLRFFEGRQLSEVGKILGTSEDAAGKRVLRALEKLRRFFTQRGVTVSAAAIAGAVSANAVQAAPEGLTISAVAAAQGSALTVSTFALIQATVRMLMWTKVKTAALIVVAVVGGGAYFIHRTANHTTRPVAPSAIAPARNAPRVPAPVGTYLDSKSSVSGRPNQDNTLPGGVKSNDLPTSASQRKWRPYP